MNVLEKSDNFADKAQCRHFVQRKKRFCRMTVRPGKHYCGEHDPDQPSEDGQLGDKRVPCPLDPKHTCYASKLEKHLKICNAKQGDVPEYIVHNINAPKVPDVPARRLLNEIPKDVLLKIINKINNVYDGVISGTIAIAPDEVHAAVAGEIVPGAERASRHARQSGALLAAAERAGLVHPHTCYVELGAGKGHLSYYVCNAWCGADSESGALLVDRAALRHKRDNALRGHAASVRRLRADLAHVALARVPAVRAARRTVGLAKHLCGVATDLALRCLADCAAGAVIATCCHHRCESALYVANDHLAELGINGEDMNAMLGIVSWATCGDGRSRSQRNQLKENELTNQTKVKQVEETSYLVDDVQNIAVSGSEVQVNERLSLTREYKEDVGRKAKAILDWGRVLYLREKGFDASLCYFVPTSVSLENVCIIAKRI